MKKSVVLALLLSLVMFASVGAAQTIETDVVIVGSGGAGLTAAIEAAIGGADVIILERLAFAGGETLISGGGMQAGGSSIQEAKGIEDSPAALYKYWMEKGSYKIDSEMASLIAGMAPANIEWLMENGVPMTPETLVHGSWSPKDPERFHRAVGGGAGLILPLVETAEKLGVKILYNTRATELVLEGDRVVGVKAEGQTSLVKAKVVILATGGFGANPEFLAKYAPDFVNAVPITTPGNMGDGLMMAEAVNAMTSDVFSAIGYFTTPVSLSPNVYVNKQGQRFLDETIFYGLKAEALIKNDGIAYDIFDQTFVNSLSEANQTAVAQAVEKGTIVKGDSLTDLAHKLDIPADALEATISEFNANTKAGFDPHYYRDATTMRTVENGPFYGMPVQLAHLGSIGGIVTNIDAQVLNVNGEVVPGLYAAGSVTGGFLGEVYPGSGSAISMVVTMGRVAGMNAAAEVAAK